MGSPDLQLVGQKLDHSLGLATGICIGGNPLGLSS